MKHLLYTGFLLLFATACHQKNPASQNPASQPEAGPSDSAKKNFFPVEDYLRSEILYVDSTPLAIHKYTTEGRRTDSTFIDATGFNGLAMPFIAPDMGWDKLEKEYTEKSFMDETTGYMTLLYSTANKSLALNRVDVLAKLSGSHEEVKSVYLEKVYSSGDTTVVKKMYWKTHESFLIITSLQPPGKEAQVRQLKVVWGDNQ